jgi:hypothetical protein
MCRPILLAGFLLTFALAFVARAEETALPPGEFFRGLNLNGPPVIIDGNAWEGKQASWYATRAAAMENQRVELTPATDATRAAMIRSSRWAGDFKLELTDVPADDYLLYAYVWEDNDPQTYGIAVNGRTVVEQHESGAAGAWQRLGPWSVSPRRGVIRLESRGGDANFSGVEIWRKNPPSTANLEFFEKRIRPLLVTHCYECHSATAKSVEGNLLLDSAPGTLLGGDRGPAVVPGDLPQSLLIRAVRYADDELQMPPAGQLSPQEIADLEEWVRRGAPDPRSEATKTTASKIDWAKARQHWAYQPIQRPPLPAVNDAAWPGNEIDYFLLARLEQEGLRPVADADKRTLIRRVTFDLTGLPPAPVDVAAFLADESPDAFAKVVDRLLASPQYGERWGRHWLDLVRYADTAGDNSDYPVPQMYLYRNWVIEALNSDKPYDQFLREQIAGDLLPATNDAERTANIIATGYIALSRRFGSVIDRYPYHLTIEDTIDNLGRTVLGLTINCARCHDHKFDAISQHDYYAMYGVFESTRYPFPGIELDKKPRDLVSLPGGGDLAYAVAEAKGAHTRVQRRGEPGNLGDEVPRRTLELFDAKPLLSDDAQSQSGRLQLAQWLTDGSQPLTARVAVNRLWQHHFGAGLVATPSDFGVRGQPPSHPELLDWLADRLTVEGWSLKKMHRLMLLSHAYRLSSGDDPQALAADPSNSLRWRFTRRRLDAESLRDALLFVSGRLDLSPQHEPYPFPPVEKWNYTQHYPFNTFYPSNRRSVYLLSRRLNALPYFTTFDGPDANASTPKRDSSVTTVQSLYLLNDPFVHEQAQGLAARLLRETAEEATRVALAFELVVARPPRDTERIAAAAFLAQSRAQLAAGNAAEAEREQQAYEALARVLFRINEFMYVD